MIQVKASAHPTSTVVTRSAPYEYPYPCGFITQEAHHETPGK